MQLKLIEEFIRGYKFRLKTTPPAGLFKWESQQIWQSNFTLDTPDPAAMFDLSLENSETRRLWQTSQFFPKKMMLEFWQMDAMTTRAAFSDLFDETKLVENRLSRFVFSCDVLLADFRSANPLTRQTEHFHDDYRLPSLYLAFQYPTTYAPYEVEILKTTLERLGSRDIPTLHDPARWFKVAATLQKMLLKDPEISSFLKRWTKPPRYFSGETLLLAEDFCRFIAS